MGLTQSRKARKGVFCCQVSGHASSESRSFYLLATRCLTKMRKTRKMFRIRHRVTPQTEPASPGKIDGRGLIGVAMAISFTKLKILV